MSILQRIYSALGRIAILAGLAAAFLFGMAGVVYMSLQGAEVKVPEITGKDFNQSEKELASLGLKIKKRADRFSTDAPNTILEQLPRPGETVKTGQMILVVVSKSNGETEQPPSTLKPSIEEDDTEKIEKMISDQPKKKPNANKKKTDKTRDVDDNSNSDANSNSNSGATEANSAKKPAETPDRDNKKNENDKKPATSPNGKPSMKPIIIEVPPRKPTKP